jgi:VanZ family protein
MPPTENQPTATPSLPVLRILVLTVWVMTIAWMSLDPSPPEIGGVLAWDKLQHVLAYGFLALLIARVLACRLRGHHRAAWWQAWIAATLFGLLLEILQLAMQKGRSAEWQDLLADALGALIVCVLFRQISILNWGPFRRKRQADG